MPYEQQTTLDARYSDEAEQSGSRQALLSTAQDSGGTNGQLGMQPLMERQPWKGSDSGAGACSARCTRMLE